MTTEALIDGMLTVMDGGAAWCQRALARNERGDAVIVGDPTAVRYCVQGAALRVLGWNASLNLRASWDWIEALKCEPAWKELGVRLHRILGYEEGALFAIGYWNNTRPHYGEIKAALEAAREDGK